ncbi:MAG: hypothetical protein D6820_04835, partial [Lentisphaerae bacterium]
MIIRLLLATFLTGWICVAAPAKKKKRRKQDFTPRVAKIGGLTARLKTGHPYHIVEPGRQVSIALGNASAHDANARLDIVLSAYSARAASHSARLTVPAGKTIEWPIPKTLYRRLGCYTVKITLEVAGKKATAWGSFAHMKPCLTRRQRGNEFIFAIAYGAAGGKRNEAQIASLAGINYVRLNPHWGRVQKKPGTWDWTWIDEQMKAHEDRGIQVQFLISGTASWAAVGPHKPGVKLNCRPPRLDAWREWLTALAKRYKHRVRFWEIWNEPDLGFFNGTVE